MKLYQKMNELGRSMVEILGVLAVIGVLSIGAIQGYRYAFNKYQSNEIINELNIRAHDISQRMETLIKNNHVGEINMEMGNVTRSGYPITARMSPQYTDYFEMFVYNVPSDVCKQLLQSQWQAPYSIFVGITEYQASVEICEQAKTVNLAYEFYKDININPDSINEDKKHTIARCIYDSNCKCGHCENNICISDCNANETCVKDYSDLTKMVCCNTDLARNGYCCSSITEDGKCCDKNNQCCPDDKPIMMKNGTCKSCNTTEVLSVADMKTNCESMCPNRVLYKGRYENRCILPCGIPGTSTEGKPIPDSWGSCKACNDSTSFIYMSDKYTSTEYANWCSNACTNRVVNGSACALLCPSGQMRDENGKCVDCDSQTTIPLSYNDGKCKEICSNRKIGGKDNKYCILDECPDNTIRMKSGACVSCDSTDRISVADLDEDCETACPNRIFYKGCYENRCNLPCGIPGTSTAGKPIPDCWGACYACDTATSILMTTRESGVKEGCEIDCPNRDLNSSNQCVFRECPEGFFADTSNKCYPCDSALEVATDLDKCTVCLNRTLKSGKCILVY